MRIVCSKCNTEYDIELPRSAVEGKHRSLKFRCSSCGFIFTTHLDAARAAAPEEDAAKGKKATAPAKGILLKQEGKIYNVRDLATLQRWVVERRVLRDDMVSFGGAVWEKVAARPELESFFELVDKADQATEESSDAWVSWDRGATPAPSESTGEILGALEAEDEPDAGLATEEAETEQAEDDRGVRLRDDLSGVLPPAPRDEGVGIPAFPMGGLSRPDPLAVGARATGQTSRDQVFDAFPMDEVGDAAASAPTLSANPAAPSSATAARPADPVVAPVSVPAAIGAGMPPGGSSTSPGLGALSPALGQGGGTVPVPMPVPVASTAGNTLPPTLRKSRELDWDEGRGGRGAPPVNWTLIGVVAIVVFGIGLVVLLRQQPVVVMTPQPAYPPVAASTAAVPAAPAPAPSAPAPEVAPTPAPTPAPAPTPTAPEATAPAAPATPTASAAEPAAEKPVETSAADTKPSSAGSSAGRSLTKQGWAALDRGDNAKARSLCLDALAANPANADAHYCVAMASEGQGDLNTAVQRYCKARSLSEDSVMVREIEGILKRLGRSCP